MGQQSDDLIGVGERWTDYDAADEDQSEDGLADLAVRVLRRRVDAFGFYLALLFKRLCLLLK